MQELILFTTMRGDVNIFCKFGTAAAMLLLFGCAGSQNSPDLDRSTSNTATIAVPATPPIIINTSYETTNSSTTGQQQSPAAPKSNVESSLAESTTNPDQPIIQQTDVDTDHTATNPEGQHTIHRTNLWERVRAGFGLPDMDSRFVTLQEQWMSKRPDYVERLLQRSRRYLPYIVEQVAARGMPMEIALLPAIESAYRPTATSRTRAAGLWQFMPATGKHFGLKQNWWLDQRRGLIASTDAALTYLDKLHQRFNGDWLLALAAYNAGEANIERAIRYNRRHRRDTHFQNLRLRLETRQYIPKLIAFRNIINAPESFGLTLPRLPAQSSYALVPLPDQLDLGIAAKMMDIPVAELLAVNGNFRRWATPPGKGYTLLIPASKAPAFKQALSNLPANQRIRWAHYQVRKGDTLGAIAHRHRVSLASIKRSNHIRGHLINIGQNLMIPLSEAATTQLAKRNTGNSRKKKYRARSQRHRSFVHRVRNGDTLWGIARRYQVNVAQLLSWNALRKQSILHRGQPIRIFTAN